MGREGKGRKGRGEGEGGEGTGREGTPNILLHPQFQFSRNMPGLDGGKANYLCRSGETKFVHAFSSPLKTS